jgi:hypothetical protein
VKRKLYTGCFLSLYKPFCSKVFIFILWFVAALEMASAVMTGVGVAELLQCSCIACLVDVDSGLNAFSLRLVVHLCIMMPQLQQQVKRKKSVSEQRERPAWCGEK